MPSRVLLVKAGYGETLDPDTDGAVSLGDILRSTVLLHAFPAATHHVTWLVDPAGAPLLANNPAIARVVTARRAVPPALAQERFDIVVNLEKHAGLCRALEQISATVRHGFRYDEASKLVRPCAHTRPVFEIVRSAAGKRQNARSWSTLLFAMIGKRYAGEPYLMAAPDVPAPTHDVGLNHLVGTKFPHKRWPDQQWLALEKALSPNVSVSWQEGRNDIATYIDWIARGRSLVTNDSLGLHIAIALGKPAVALFGPTHAAEIDDWPGLTKLTPPQARDCTPCAGGMCLRPRPCISEITVETVASAARKRLALGHAAAA